MKIRSSAQILATKQNWRLMRICGIQKQADIIIKELKDDLPEGDKRNLKAGLFALSLAHKSALKNKR
jgi:Holliday junction resolvasome RuvABC DNA-binding subunit